MKRAVLFILALLPSAALAETSCFSIEAPYRRFLELEGDYESSYLAWRSYEDEVLSAHGNDAPLGVEFTKRLSLGPLDCDLLLPEAFFSWNSDYPHGMNDGALWQGVGANVTTTAGIRLEALGFSATLRPELHYSQNLDFDLMPTAYPDSGGFGYIRRIDIDAYQRPGDEPVLDWSWGDSEIRYTWRTATIGFGTQSIWAGPGLNTAIILSDNAAPFPKLDLGLRKTSTPIGDIEARGFLGRLTESEWFNDDPSDDYTLFSGIVFAWSPRFFPELTLGFNRVLLAAWDDDEFGSFLQLFNPEISWKLGHDELDQRVSFTAELRFAPVGFRLWVEWARNDYNTNPDSIIRYPFHSQAYATGLEKSWRFDDPRYGLMLEAELANTESSRDYQLWGPAAFYGHHIIRHGQTNEGQIIGAGFGTGGTYQRLAFTLFHPSGSLAAYAQRMNRDNDYVYFLHDSRTTASEEVDSSKFNTEITLGLDSSWELRGIGYAGFGAAYNWNHNPHYESAGADNSIIFGSLYLSSSLKITL